MSPDPGITFNGEPHGFGCYTNYSNPTCYLTVSPTGDDLLRIYTSEDGTTYTLLYTHPTDTVGEGDRIIQDSNFDIWFGTTDTDVFRLS
jgi:hypothetical protein